MIATALMIQLLRLWFIDFYKYISNYVLHIKFID